jgi:hypothetical protein
MKDELMAMPAMQSALAKLGKVAMLYDRHRDSLRGFHEGPPLTASIFNVQLRRQFGLKLSPRELGCLVRYFDDDGDGYVDGAEFLSEFFRMATGAIFGHPSLCCARILLSNFRQLILIVQCGNRRSFHGVQMLDCRRRRPRTGAKSLGSKNSLGSATKRGNKQSLSAAPPQRKQLLRT